MSSERYLLLVEDNPGDELLALRALNKAALDCAVRVARDGEEALELLFGAEPLPIFVMLDLKLPKVDGLKVLSRLRATPRTRCLPVTVLTSSDERKDMLDCCRLGANSYVRKPVDARRYSELLGQIVRYWVQVNEHLPTGD